MTNKIIPSQDITVDTVKEVFQSAYHTMRPYNSDPATSHVFTVEFWDIDVSVSVDVTSKTIKMFAFLYPEESSKEALILHANYLNNNYGLAKFMVEEEPYDDEGNYYIFADYILNAKTGLDPFILIDTMRIFHDMVALAGRENVAEAEE